MGHAIPSAPAFVVHGVAAGDGYASRSAVAGRRTSLCASCDPHGPRARRGSFPVGRDREHPAATSTRRLWRTAACRPREHAAATRTRRSWASRGGEGRPAAARQEPSAAREGRTPDRAESRWPDPPTGSPCRTQARSDPPTGSPFRARARHPIRRQARLPDAARAAPGDAQAQSPYSACRAANTASPAVSVRNTRGPSRTPSKPA